MRPSYTTLVLSLSALITTGVLATGALGHGGPGGPLFSRLAAGAYVVDIPARSETYLFAIDAHGGVFSEDSNDFGDGVPAASQSAFYGTWKRTGQRELVYTVLTLAYDAGGVLSTIVRHSAAVQFDEGFQTFSQQGTFAVFAAVQDPLDPGEVPLATGEFSGTGRRIPAVVE